MAKLALLVFKNGVQKSARYFKKNLAGSKCCENAILGNGKAVYLGADLKTRPAEKKEKREKLGTQRDARKKEAIRCQTSA